MRAANETHTAEALSKALDDVKWGPGRRLTPAIASKCITIYNRFGAQQPIVDTIILGQTLFGRDSPVDEWTKLSILATGEHPLNEMLWVMQTIVEERRVRFINCHVVMTS